MGRRFRCSGIWCKEHSATSDPNGCFAYKRAYLRERNGSVLNFASLHLKCVNSDLRQQLPHIRASRLPSPQEPRQFKCDLWQVCRSRGHYVDAKGKRHELRHLTASVPHNLSCSSGDAQMPIIRGQEHCPQVRYILR